MKKSLCGVIVVLFLLGGFDTRSFVQAADMKRGLQGESTGLVTAKGQKWIEILQEGAVKRYILFGSLPEDKKKIDQKLAKEISKIRVNSRVKIVWEFQKYLRVVGIQLLEKP